MADKIVVDVGGQPLEVEKDTPVYKSLMRALEAQEEAELAAFVTSASEKLLAAVKATWGELTDEEKTAISKKSLLAEFSAKNVNAVGLHQSSMVNLRQRAVRSDAQ